MIMTHDHHQASSHLLLGGCWIGAAQQVLVQLVVCSDERPALGVALCQHARQRCLELGLLRLFALVRRQDQRLAVMAVS